MLAGTGVPQTCECGGIAEKIYLKMPGTVFLPDVCYDSPIDGRPITSRKAREEDMARNGCVEYDPEMRTDQSRRVAAEEAALDRKSDEHVEQFITELSAVKRENLVSELESGVDAQITRT